MLLDSSTLPDPLLGWFSPFYASSPRVPSQAVVDAYFAALKSGSPPSNGGGPVSNLPVYSSLAGVERFPWNYVFVSDGVDAGFKNQSYSVSTSNVTGLPSRGSEAGKSGMWF